MSAKTKTAKPAIDPVALCCDLVRCPSVTPAEGGAIALLEKILGEMGFSCTRLRFEEDGTEPVENLYARLGTTAPNFCFAGHTDVVPVGDTAAWSFDPFGGTVQDGWICGRGAADMKGGIAAFVAAVSRHLSEHGRPKGSISLLITGDEEAIAINGTKKVLEWMERQGEKIDACVVGEPTNPKTMGDMIKIGRRGTITGHLTVQGTQGHVAYPHLADNPLPKMVTLLAALDALVLDDGTPHFQPSNLEIVTIDTGNAADNVIPASVSAKFNIRFNDRHSGASLETLLRATLEKTGIAHTLSFHAGGESFLTPPGPLSALVTRVVERKTGRRPELSTTGGTSDARFISRYCPVVEFGIVGQTMHKVDERIRADDLVLLTDIYADILAEYFRQNPVT